MTAIEYRNEHEKLMTNWENDCRKWLKDMGKDQYVVENIPFFKDGVVCPEVWFDEKNDFRPMFILKEVSIGKDSVEWLKKFNSVWDNKTCFDFVEDKFDDVRIGTFKQWKRIAKLAKGLEEVHNGIENCDYYGKNKDYSFVPGEMYTGNIEGYKTAGQDGQRNANANYNEIINKIAVVEMKKIGGGTSVGSKLSLETMYYLEHKEKFEEYLLQQIKLINPTVVICLGRENKKCIRDVLKNIEVSTNAKWIDGYHHVHSSNVNFYDNPLYEYRKFIKECKKI